MIGKPLHFTTAKEWRAWLHANHAVQQEAWLMISKKQAATHGVSLEEATEEALCFGWIDSSMKPIDGERYVLRFTPRRQRSRWSETNRRRVAKLIQEGRMTEAGLAKIDEAKQNGEWDEVER